MSADKDAPLCDAWVERSNWMFGDGGCLNMARYRITPPPSRLLVPGAIPKNVCGTHNHHRAAGWTSELLAAASAPSPEDLS